MGNSHTKVQASNKEGQTLDVQHTQTDSPIVPVESIRQLRDMDPRYVDWLLEQTAAEGAHRRKNESRVNFYILLERLSGVTAALLVAIFGLAAGAYCILQGHDWAGASICGVFLASIVGIFVTKEVNKTRQNSNDKSEAKGPVSKK